ncbi:aspartyl protease family protein At5g10770-like [Syzygium oleosum]|uniref:aspartyl protease family protein At5g10770-like n=1 Tax=Syzygium oleosum TaxID=219896 RepID=UPI0024B87CAC|nr:aspartyl protease family protein At5g10770-like [Syzygium oleosum]
MAVGGTVLEIPSIVFSKAEAIIDSRTVITRLPPTAYNAMRMAFRKEMASYKMAKSFELFDTYDLRNTKSVVVPKIRFTFSGGTFMDLDHSGILYTISDSQVCLAFVPNNDDTNIIIYGNVQQTTFEVIYDVARGQLGFAPNGCM